MDGNTNNRVTLLVQLGVDTSNKSDIQLQIDKLAEQLKGLKVNITINDKAIAALEKLSNMDFTKISTGAKKANEEVAKESHKTVEQIKADYVALGDKLGGVFKDMFNKGNFLKSSKEIQEALKKIGQDVKVTFDVKDGVANMKALTASYLKDGITTQIKFRQDTLIGGSGKEDEKYWTPQAITQIDKSVSNANKSIEKITESAKKLFSQGKITEEQLNKMNNSISNLGNNPTSSVKKLNNELDGMVKKTAEMKTAQKSVQDFVKHLDQLLHSGRITSVQFEQMVGSIGKLKTPTGLIQLGQELKQMTKGNIIGTDLAAKIDKTTTSMEKLLSRGKLTQEQFNRLNAEIAKVYLPEQMKNVNKKLGTFVDDNRKQAQALKEVEAAEKRIFDNEMKRKNLLLEIERAMKQQPKTLDQNAAKNLFNTVSKLNTESKKFSENLRINALELKKLKVAATESSRANTSLMESFKIAMQKFPVWMAASTLFFSSIRTAREFVRIIVDIDTKMTSLAKVMSEDTNLATIFEQATASAEKFGQTVSQVLDSYAEFARQGFKGDDLGILAEAGLIAANVGEITAQNASELLTASLVQWKLEAKDALGVIDSFNAISNNYATTLEKLGRGHARSAATARAMGLSFDQVNGIIGSITAATKQSGDEIGNFLKNVLPRLVGKPAQDALESLNISLSDDKGNMRDVIEVYTEVANKIKDVSDIQRVAVVEGLAGKFHISRMQALLDDLGSADSMYRSIYETSVNSAGSASIENEKYMKSLQARINLARVEVEKLAVAMGEAFVSEGLITFLKVFGSGMKAVTELTKVIGALPIVLGVLAVALALVSTRVRTFGTALLLKTKALATSIVTKKQAILTNGTYTRSVAYVTSAKGKLTISTNLAALAMARHKAAVDKATISSGRLTVATNVLKNAFRALGSATLIGLSFVAIGFLIEGITKLIGKNRELKESAETANKALTESYKNNALAIEGALSNYAKLEKANAIDPYNLENREKYRDIQNELGNLMPSLITGEDEYGRKIVDSSTNIATKIEMIKEQIRIENDLAKVKAREDRKENIKGNNEIVEDAKKSAEKEIKRLTMRLNNINDTATMGVVYSGKFKIDFEDSKGIPLIKSLGDIATYIDIIDEKRKKAEASGDDKLVKYYDKLRTTLGDTSEDLIGYDLVMRSTLNNQKTLYAETIADMIDSQLHLDSYTKTSFTELTNKFFQFADATEAIKLEEIFSKIIGDADLSSALAPVTEGFSALNKATDENFDEIASKVQESISIVKPLLLEFGLSPEEANAIMAGFDKIYESAIEGQKAVAEVMKENPEMTVEQATAAVKAATDETNELAEAVENAAEAYDKLVDNISFANGVLEDYQENNYLTASSLLEIIDKYPELMMYMDDEARLIEELTKLRDNDISLAKDALVIKMEDSKEFYEGNLKLIQAFVKENFSFYDKDLQKWANLAEAKADIEVQLINDLIKKWGVYYSETSKTFINDSHDRAATGYNVNSATQELMKSRDLFKNFTLDKININFKSLGTSLDSYSKSKEKDNKTTKESIYVTDKFKQALEALNLEIEKQQKLRTNMTNYSQAYRNSLAKEIQLEKQKLTLLQNQLASLKKQVATGKINQTGTVSSGTTTSTSSSRKLSGWTGKRTSNYGWRYFQGKTQFHGGIDTAMAKGTRLDANVSGKVIASGNASKNGYHSTYGNIVVVQDSSGMKHLYAHLDKAIAKLGSTIAVGQQLGTIGSTGNSTGPHLHYEVRNKSGKTINPSAYLAAAQKLVITTQASTKTVSGTQKAIDEAKSTILSLESDILTAIEKIEKLESDIINSNLEAYNQKRETAQRSIDYENEKIKSLDVTSQAYITSQKSIITNLEKKQTANKEELAYLEGLIKNGKLSANVLAEMQARAQTLKTEMLALSNSIQDVNASLATAQLESFSRRRGNVQYSIDYEAAKSKPLDTSSKAYLDSQNRIRAKLSEKQVINWQELAYLEGLIKNGKLSAEVLKEMKDRADALKIEILDLEYSVQELDFNKITVQMGKFEEQIDDLNFLLQRSQHLSGLLKEGSADYNKEIKYQISLLEQQQTAILAQRDELTRLLNTSYLSAEMYKELTEKIEDLNLEYWSLANTIQDTTEALEETNKRVVQETADALINAYKEYLSEKRDMQIKALEKEMDAEDKRHKKIMDNYQKELDDYRKLIQGKIDLIDKEESEANYGKEMDKLEEERLKILNKLNLISMDDSFEAKAERKKLQEELASIDENIAEKQHEKEVNDRKENLNKLIEDKEEEIRLKEELEDSRYESERERIDKLREYWNQFYEDQLNDERKFEKIRSQIVSGNFGALSSEFQKFLTEMRDTMPSLENTLDGTMKAVGTSIRQNIIENLLEAIKMLETVQKDQKALGIATAVGNLFNFNRNIAGLSTGGFTGKFDGGKLGVLHEQEVILDKKETKEFFKYAPILERLNQLINPIKLPMIKQPALASDSNTPPISITFEVEKMIANESTAKNLAKTVLSEVNNTLKRERGIR